MVMRYRPKVMGVRFIVEVIMHTYAREHMTYKVLTSYPLVHRGTLHKINTKNVFASVSGEVGAALGHLNKGDDALHVFGGGAQSLEQEALVVVEQVRLHPVHQLNHVLGQLKI